MKVKGKGETEREDENEREGESERESGKRKRRGKTKREREREKRERWEGKEQENTQTYIPSTHKTTQTTHIPKEDVRMKRENLDREKKDLKKKIKKTDIFIKTHVKIMCTCHKEYYLHICTSNLHMTDIVWKLYILNELTIKSSSSLRSGQIIKNFIISIK
ncbi:hypothetical protein RhiirA4_430873 [Rhizophagus irregularis]|uniref:Uncharacterized protein n=1 Tax=Rhizophagus irregularis TaxID=588596 RepID=A0A2I1HML2_9GLOM|nr:hypothetical protein RhiirA4_430873 [Rhizophagus irregularis]